MDEPCSTWHRVDEDFEVEFGGLAFFAGGEDSPVAEAILGSLIESASCCGVECDAFAEDVFC